MIQITKWLNPDDEMWYKKSYITVFEWLTIETEHIAKFTGKHTIIKTNPEGYKAIFRKRIK